MKKNKYEDVKNDIESFGYKLLSTEYKNNREKLKIQCDKGHIYKANYETFKRGIRCSCCYGNKKNKYEDVKSYIESFGYKLLSTEYKNNREKLKIQCDKGHIYEANYNKFITGRRCSFCSKTKKKKYEDVKNDIESFGYKLLSTEYKKINEKLRIQCDKGHIYETKYMYFHKGSRCPICNNRKLQYEDIKNDIESFGYKLLSTEYKRINEKLRMQCDKGHIFNAIYSNFKQGTRCPYCNKSSKGENKILNYLINNNFIFQSQYTFKDCNDISILRFDFAILNKFNELIYLIEYDGIQHFKPIDFFGGEKAFIKLKKRDRIKNEYCIKNNIKIIRISYKEFNKIENILEIKIGGLL